ncbi:hypothetical protein HMI55_006940 [Coelomomyces lativittatus]|nr:hypothetical protein HMI55_006940 [Coelomomyces lativittatus]
MELRSKLQKQAADALSFPEWDVKETEKNSSSSLKSRFWKKFTCLFTNRKQNFKPKESGFKYKKEKWIPHATLNMKLPRMLNTLEEYLIQSTLLKRNGLFRINGNYEKIEKFIKEHAKYKQKNINSNIQSQKYTYEIADVYKRYLRERPTPIFSPSLNKKLKELTELEPSKATFEKLRNMIYLLDVESQQILKHTLYISSLVLEYQSFNQMDSACLSRTIGPNLFQISDIHSINSLNWTVDIYELLLMKHVDYWFTLPLQEIC